MCCECFLTCVVTVCVFSENIPKSEAAHLIDPHVTILIERLNDGQTKIRDAAMKTLKFIVANTAVGSTVIANQCLRAVPAKQKTAWRPICNRLQMVLDIINTTGVSHKSGNTVDNVLGFMKNHDTFTHSNGDVRDVTKAICVAMAKIVGPDVIVPQLEPVLRKTQFEDYMLAFGIAAPAPSKGASGVASNDAAPRGGSNMKSPGRKSKEMKESKDDDDAPPNFSTCMFCGTSDPTWNEDALDLHYWKDCTMLAQCPACAQVTEIAGLPNHLQEECEQKEHYVFDEVTGKLVILAHVLLFWGFILFSYLHKCIRKRLFYVYRLISSER